MNNQFVFKSGLKLKLLSTTSAKAKLTTTLLGCKQNKCLITEHPRLKSALVRIEKDTTWAVNFIDEGFLIGFSSHVLGTSMQPLPLLYLAYPQQLERTNLRRSKRFPVNIQVKCQPLPEEAAAQPSPAPGMLRDISEGGCLLETNAPFQHGDRLSIFLTLPGQGLVDGLEAEVKNVRSTEGQRQLFGLSFFLDQSDKRYLKLKNFIDLLTTLPLRL